MELQGKFRAEIEDGTQKPTFLSSSSLDQIPTLPPSKKILKLVCSSSLPLSQFFFSLFIRQSLRRVCKLKGSERLARRGLQRSLRGVVFLMCIFHFRWWQVNAETHSLAEEGVEGVGGPYSDEGTTLWYSYSIMPLRPRPKVNLRWQDLRLNTRSQND